VKHGDMLRTLLDDLIHPDKNVRIEAALEIGKLADSRALPLLLERLGTEPDFFVRENVTWAVVRIGADAVVPLIDLLHGTDVAARFNAAHTLSKLADARAVPALLATLDDPDEKLVQKAVYALGAIGDVSALPALLERVGSGSRELRSSVNEALEVFGELAIPYLVAAMATREASVRVEVAEILGSIGGDAADGALAAAIDDADAAVRFAVVNAMRSSKGAAVQSALERATRDSHRHVQILARRILMR
jgi:HEAT repeat protein